MCHCLDIRQESMVSQFQSIFDVRQSPVLMVLEESIIEVAIFTSPSLIITKGLSQLIDVKSCILGCSIIVEIRE